MSRTAAQHYALVMRDAKDNVFLVAVRDSSLVVTAGGIAHDWLPIATGFIDTRFAKIVGTLLSDLVRKAQQAGKFI
ncbi:MAG: hypothetical protein HY067_03180 [Betaproteobacteria bacterium]|nr:hypothetical protein [Betaproteobacteria bacterium]